MNFEALPPLIERYKSDPEGVYATWFIAGEERMKAFRSIRRGVKATTDAIAANTFGNDFKGSPLEVATFGESRDILSKIARRPQDNCA